MTSKGLQIKDSKQDWSFETCERRHKWLSRMTSIILVILGLQMTFIGWTIQAANLAAAKVDAVSSTVRETTVRVEENWQSSLRQLGGVREALKEVQASQVKSDDRIIDELRCNRALVEKMMMDQKSK